MPARKHDSKFKQKLKGCWMSFSTYYDLKDVSKDPNNLPKKIRLIYEHGFKDGYESK